MQTNDIFVNLIKSQLQQVTVDKEIASLIDVDTFKAVMKLAKAHDLTVIVANSLINLPDCDEHIMPVLFREQMSALSRYERINNDLGQITELFEKENIDNIPLKGSVIRKFYPSPEMRTSCDIDILINKKDVTKAKKALVEKLKYEYIHKSSHDLMFTTASGVAFELHFNLIEDGYEIQFLDEDVWKSSKVVDGYKHSFQMTNEMFTVYHILHMAKHFQHSGTGVRGLMDLWVLKNRVGYDEQTVIESLKAVELVTFYEEIQGLMDSWFENGKAQETFSDLADYLLGSGVYGTVKNNVIFQMDTKHNKFNYVWKRIFMPFKQMRIVNPILNKWWILYPFLQMRRWFRFIFRRDKAYATNELNQFENIDDKQATNIKNLKTRLGIKL